MKSLKMFSLAIVLPFRAFWRDVCRLSSKIQHSSFSLAFSLDLDFPSRYRGCGSSGLITCGVTNILAAEFVADDSYPLVQWWDLLRCGARSGYCTSLSDLLLQCKLAPGCFYLPLMDSKAKICGHFGPSTAAFSFSLLSCLVHLPSRLSVDRQAVFFNLLLLFCFI